MSQMKRYYNLLPSDAANIVINQYNYERMREIIEWNEIHCEYWNGVDYQIGLHRKSIECYVMNKPPVQWYEDLKNWDQIELEMLLIYRRDMLIRQLLK